MEWLKPPRFSEAEKEKQTLCFGNLLLECRFCFEKGDIPDEKRKTYVFEECIKKKIGKRKKRLIFCSHPESTPQPFAYKGKHNPLRQAHMVLAIQCKLLLYITLIPFLTLSVAHSQFYFHVCLHRLQVDAFLTLKIP